VWSRLGAVVAAAPDELTVQSGVLAGPDGGPTLFVSPTWSGVDLEVGEKAIDELRRLGTPLVSQVVPRSYTEMLGLFEGGFVNGNHYAIRTRSVPGLTPDIVSALVEAGSARTSPMSAISVHHFHGAAARVPIDSTAFGIRRDHFMVEIVAVWEPGDRNGARHRAWTQACSAALTPWAVPGGYPNLLGPDDREQITHAYGQNATRLLLAKARFDPDRIFCATPLPLEHAVRL
jgi:hypothetical protein